MKREILLLFCVMALIPILAWGQNDNKTTTTRTKLRIAIPVREFSKFVEVERDPITGDYNYSGFAIEVFNTVMGALPSPISYEFVPFAKPDGTMNGTFDDMLKAVSTKDYDGAVGDISILFYRTQYVDFTMPFLESSITMLVAINRQPTTKARGFSLTDITDGILIATFAISSIVVLTYLSVILWSASTTSRRRRTLMRSEGHTKVMMLGCFVLMLLLVACYITSEASTLSSQSRSGTVKNLTQLIRMGSRVGYREGSFVVNLLLQKGIPESKLVSLKTEEEMVDMLSKGTSKGGVDAIVANAPHLKVLQAKHCDAFTTVPTTSLHATGFGFAFGKGSNLVGEVSTAILKIVDKGQLGKIQDQTIGSLETCQDDDTDNFDVDGLYLDPQHEWMLGVGGTLASVLISIPLIFHFISVIKTYFPGPDPNQDQVPPPG